MSAQTLDRAGVPDAAGVLARALASDPGWCHVFPADATRVARMTRTLRLMIAGAYVSHGTSLAVPGAAAAIWTPPGAHDVPLSTSLALAPRLVWLLGRRTPHGLRLYRAMNAGTPREPHYYLAILGVDPGHQGRGLGVTLCAPILARCDETRTLAWLESTNPRNHAFYLRLGFTVAHETAIPGGPTLTFFARQPR